MNLFHVLWPMTVILACACVVSSSFGETAAAAASHHSTLSFEDATDVHARVEDRLGGTLGSSARMRRGIVQEARKTFLSMLRSFEELRKPHASPQYDAHGQGLRTNGNAQLLGFLANGGYDTRGLRQRIPPAPVIYGGVRYPNAGRYYNFKTDEKLRSN